MIVLIRLLNDVEPTEWISRGLMALFKAISDPKIDEEEKLLPIDIIGRLGHIPTGRMDGFRLSVRVSILSLSIP